MYIYTHVTLYTSKTGKPNPRLSLNGYRQTDGGKGDGRGGVGAGGFVTYTKQPSVPGPPPPPPQVPVKRLHSGSLDPV